MLSASKIHRSLKTSKPLSEWIGENKIKYNADGAYLNKSFIEWLNENYVDETINNIAYEKLFVYKNADSTAKTALINTGVVIGVVALFGAMFISINLIRNIQ